MHWSSLALLSLLQREFCYNSVKKFDMKVNRGNTFLSDNWLFLWHQFNVVKWFPSLQHVILFVWRAETSLHRSPAVTALCSHSQYFIFVCLLSCFLLLPSSTFLANCSSLVALSFCCLLSPVLMCTFLLPPFLFSSSSSTPSLIVTFPSLFTVVPPPLPFVVFPLHHLPLPPGGYGWTAGAAAVSPQYVQHAVPTPRPTRLWDPPHLPSTFTFSFTPAPLGPPGGKPQSVKVSVKGTSLILANTIRHHPSSHQHDAGR